MQQKHKFRGSNKTQGVTPTAIYLKTISSIYLKTISSPNANGIANSFWISLHSCFDNRAKIIDKATENYAPLEVDLIQSIYREL